MSFPIGGKSREKVLIELIEADVDIGFSLVDDAKSFRASGQSEFSLRVLQDAAGVLAEIDGRLQQLGDSESKPFHALVAELRGEIAALGWSKKETP